MLRRVLSSARYMMLIPVLCTFLGSLALMVYEALAVATATFDALQNGGLSPKAVKAFAVGLIEAVDVFLIAIAVFIISMGLYTLFIDDSLPLPAWMKVSNLDDLKGNLISVIIAVLAVYFLREVVAWDGSRDIVALGLALSMFIGVLTFFLMKIGGRKG